MDNAKKRILCCSGGKDSVAKKIWYNGMDEAIKQIKPKQILVYGGDIGYKFPKSIKVKYYDTKAFKEDKY